MFEFQFIRMYPSFAHSGDGGAAESRYGHVLAAVMVTGDVEPSEESFYTFRDLE